MRCKQQTRKIETKLYIIFFTIKLIENYLGNVETGFAESFSVERLDPLALRN